MIDVSSTMHNIKMFKLCDIVKDKSLKHTSTSSLLQVGLHAVVVREHGGRGSNLCAHVTNGCHSCTHTKKRQIRQQNRRMLHMSQQLRTKIKKLLKCNKVRFQFCYFLLTSAGNGVNSWTVVLHNGSSASLHCQDASHLQDDILRRRPA